MIGAAYPPPTQPVSIFSGNKTICNAIVYPSTFTINCCHLGYWLLSRTTTVQW